MSNNWENGEKKHLYIYRFYNIILGYKMGNVGKNPRN